MKFRVTFTAANPTREVVQHFYGTDAEDVQRKVRELFTVERFKTIEEVKGK